MHGTMWSRKVVGGCWEEKAAEGLVGITRSCSPQWKPGPLFPTPNPDPVPASETQASPALGVTAPLQVLKTHRRSLSIALRDGAGRSPRGEEGVASWPPTLRVLSLLWLGLRCGPKGSSPGGHRRRA